MRTSIFNGFSKAGTGAKNLPSIGGNFKRLR